MLDYLIFSCEPTYVYFAHLICIAPSSIWAK
nr:MAG TPA: hypothetical protein [Caudoviricetes sp.]